VAKTRKFGRERNQRRAFLRSLAVGLITSGKIKTTLARAKALRPVAERLVTHAKKSGNLVLGYRGARKFLPKEAAAKLVKEIAPKYEARNGGYTRIIKLNRRGGDASQMALIEFV